MSRKTILLKDFAACERFLGGKTQRKLPSVRETYVVSLIPGIVSIVYRGTAVVTHYRDGRTLLRSGGYRTVTTKRRMNQHSKCQVFQKNHVWYVSLDNHTQEYRDSMVVCGLKPHDYHQTKTLF